MIKEVNPRTIMIKEVNPRNILITLKRIKKNMLNKPGNLGPQQAMSDLDSMCNICEREALNNDFREALVIEGVESKDVALADLTDAIKYYTKRGNYKLVTRHAKEAERITNNNTKWYDYNLVKHYGLSHRSATKARISKIIKDLTEDVKAM